MDVKQLSHLSPDVKFRKSREIEVNHKSNYSLVLTQTFASWKSPILMA